MTYTETEKFIIDRKARIGVLRQMAGMKQGQTDAGKDFITRKIDETVYEIEMMLFEDVWFCDWSTEPAKTERPL